MAARARLLVGDVGEGLSLGFARLGLPAAARESLGEKLPSSDVLLSGLRHDEARFLTACAEDDAIPGRERYPRFVAGDPVQRPGTALLCGRKEQFDRLLEACGKDASFQPLGETLGRALGSLSPPAPLQLGARTLVFGARTYVMGIVNVTPDSFSDGGQFPTSAAAIAHGLALESAGADILDVGGESTRPGAKSVSADEELARVLPVIEGLRAASDVAISIDTTKATVAEAAIAAGATLVNDVSGFTFDPRLPGVVARGGAACALMHLKGTPETMQRSPEYGDLIDEVLIHLEAGVSLAVAAGIPRERLLVDPGIGFAKTADHNVFLLRRLQELRCLGLPLLVGTSRKAFIGKLTGREQASERVSGTLGSVAAVAALRGADIVRVHDVREAREALLVVEAIVAAREGGTAYRTR